MYRPRITCAPRGKLCTMYLADSARRAERTVRRMRAAVSRESHVQSNQRPIGLDLQRPCARLREHRCLICLSSDVIIASRLLTRTSTQVEKPPWREGRELSTNYIQGTCKSLAGVECHFPSASLTAGCTHAVLASSMNCVPHLTDVHSETGALDSHGFQGAPARVPVPSRAGPPSNHSGGKARNVKLQGTAEH